MSVEDGDFKKGRFRPAMIALGVVMAAGAATAIALGVRSDSEHLSTDQISTIKKDIYVMPRAAQIPKWHQLTEQGTVDLQQEALTQLAFLGDKDLVRVATKALENVDHRVRGTAAQALVYVALPEAEPARQALRKAFKEADSSDQPQLAWAMVALNEKSAWKDIMEVYRAGHLASVERLGGGRAFDVDLFAKMASSDEWATLAGDPSDSVRQLVAGILSRTGDKKYSAALTKLVNDPKTDVAREAASGLGKIGDPASLKPLTDALTRADKDDRQRFLEALRDGIGGEGLVLALGSVAKGPPESAKFQTKQIFDMIHSLADPRAADALAGYLSTKPMTHWMTEAALRLAEVGDLRAVPYLADRMRLDPLKVYDEQIDPEYRRDDNERVIAARMLADLAVVHPQDDANMRATAEDRVMFWIKDKPQPHANGLRFLAAVNSKKVLPDLRTWANPSVPLPKEGQAGAFPREYESAQSALRYLGWIKDSWGILDRQLNRKDPKLDITEQGLVGAGLSMMGMALRGLAVGASQGFAQWGDPKAFPIMIKFLEDPKQNEGARMEACRSVAWAATDDNMREVLKKARNANAKDPQTQFYRACLLETLIRKPVHGAAPMLLEMLDKEVDLAVRHQVARALGWPGVDDATEKALFEKMSNPEVRNDAALALILGGSEEGAARAVAMFNSQSKEALDDLKDRYFDSFGYWSDEDLIKGRIYRWVNNAESIAKVRIQDTLQDWARIRLGAQFNNLEFDTGPHSMTRVVLRYRLIDAARKGDAAAKEGAIATLKFMKQQGALMALRDDKGDTGQMARKALFELMNPKLVVAERTPEANKSSESEGAKTGK